MSENFNIRISDQIDPGVLNKLEQIALKAINAHTAIEKMEQSLSSVGSKSLGNLGNSQAQLATDINKASLAYLNEEIAINRAVSAEARALKVNEQLIQSKNKTIVTENQAAVAHEKAAQAQIATTVATTKAATVEQKLETALHGTEAAKLKVAAATTQAATAETRLATATTQSTAAQTRAEAAAFRLQRMRERAAKADATAASKVSPEEAARQQIDAQAAQADFNRLLGVNRPVVNSAKASASVFQEAFANDAKAQAEADRAATQATKERNQALREAEQELKKYAQGQREAEQAAADLERRANALINAFDPLSAAQRSHNRALSEASTLLKQGVITQQQYDTVVENATKALHENTKGLQQNAKATGFSRNQLLTFQYTFNDVVASLASGASVSTIFFQQIGQVTQAFNDEGGAMKGFINRLGLVRLGLIGVGVAAASTAGFYLAGQSELSRFNNIMKLTGNAAGFTTASYERMAQKVSEATGTSVASVLELSNKLLVTGGFQSKQIEEIVFSTQRMAKATGESTQQILNDWISAAEAPAAYADRLVKLGLLSPTVAQHVRELESLGEKTKAFDMLSRETYDRMANVVPGQMNIVIRMFGALGTAMSNAARDWRNFLNELSGDRTAVDAIGVAEKKLAEARTSYASLSNDPIFSKIKAESLKAVQAAEQEVNQLKASEKATLDAARASEDLARRKTRAGEVAKELNQEFGGLAKGANVLREQLKKLDEGMAFLQKEDPQSPVLAQLTENRASIVEQLKKRYTPPEKPDQRAALIKSITDSLSSQIRHYDKLADVRGVDQELDRLEIQLANQRLKGLSGVERAQLREQMTRAQSNSYVTESVDAIFNEARAYSKSYESAMNAIEILGKKDKATGKSILSAREIEIATRKEEYRYIEATNSLADFNREIEDNFRLLTMSADRRFVEGPILQKKRQLEPQGKRLSPEEEDYMRRSLEMMQERERQTRALDAIEAATVGTKKELIAQQNAIALAQQQGYFTTETYKNAIVGLHQSFINFNLSQGIGTFEESVMASLGRMVEGFTNAKQMMTNSFGDFFVSVQDGFATTIGDALVKGESLKEGLREVAQTALSSLLASLVKIGTQYLLNDILFDSFKKKQTVGITAQTAAEIAAMQMKTTAQVINGKVLVAAAAENAIAMAAIGTAIAAAWAPAAAAVSLATQGANAFLANAGIATTYGLTKALAVPVAGFEQGGYTGDIGRSSVAGVVHGQEFVMNAQATARNRATLEAMNNGKKTNAAEGWTVEINNYGTPQTYEVEGIDEGRIRLIARDEARGVVAEEAPNVIANDIRNPNSRTSKGLRDTHNVSRRR